MPFDVHFVLKILWLALAICWGVMAFTTKQTIRAQSRRARWIHIAGAFTAFTLLFSKSLDVPPLSARVIPDSFTAALTGLVLTAAGVGFAIWARLHLGGNWSAQVTLKQDHQLIRTGPYALVRHPIYSGALLAMIGTAIALGQLRGFLAVGVAVAAWTYKLRQEEDVLTKQFGGQYAHYQREVPALIPHLR